MVWDSKGQMILFALYLDTGGKVIVSTSYDSQGNITTNTLRTYDENGTLIETVDILAQQQLEAQQAVLTESAAAQPQAETISVSSAIEMESLDSGTMTMMSSIPETPTAASEIFAYDHLGNRYQETDKNGLTHTYSHNLVNQYEKRQAEKFGIPLEDSYLQDDNGNLQYDSYGYSYVYDYRNRLIEVNDSNSTVAEYAFDALGRRISKAVDSVTTYFFYDPQGRVIAEYEGDSLERDYVYGNGYNEVLAMFLPGYEGNPADWDAFMEFVDAWLCQDPNACYDATYDHNSDGSINMTDFAYFVSVWDMPSTAESHFYYLHDALGSVRGLVGGIYNREDDREFFNYDVYGRLSIVNPEESTSGNPYLFAGYRYDVETSLYHTDNRTYDPETGRWLQFDKTYLDSWNLYEYARSNPLMYIDPFGLTSCNDEKLDSFQQSIKAMNCPECSPSDFGPEPSQGSKGDWGWLMAWRHYLSGRTLAGSLYGDNILSSPAFSLFTGWTKFEPDYAGGASSFVPGIRQIGKPVEFSHDSKFSQRITKGEIRGLNFWNLGDDGGLAGKLERQAARFAKSLPSNKCRHFSLQGSSNEKGSMLIWYSFSGGGMYPGNDGTGTLSNGRNDQYSKVSYRAKCCVKNGCSNASLKCRVRIDIHDLFSWDSIYPVHLLGKDYWQIVHFDKFLEKEIDMNN
jgi:RHS repeat-associated protein